MIDATSRIVVVVVRAVRRASLLPMLFILLAPATGCSVGPDTVARDRFNYGEALATSQREEILQNLVRLRYVESPIFLNISTVVNQYSIEGSIDAGFGWAFGSSGSGTTNTIGGEGRYYDRPTITYAPMSGDQFVEAYLRPILPQSLMTLVQSGYQIDFLFPLMLQSINGHGNANHMARQDRFASPKFTRIVELMNSLQLSGTLRVRAFPSTPSVPTARVYLEWVTPTDPAGVAEVQELVELLGLPPDLQRAEVVFGEPVEGKIALITRSAMAILLDVASYIDIPPEDVERGLVRRGMPSDQRRRAPMRIHSGEDEPTGAYVAIQHRDTWFWIAEDDVDSKICFLALVILSNISQQSTGGGPVLTIPAG